MPTYQFYVAGSQSRSEAPAEWHVDEVAALIAAAKAASEINRNRAAHLVEHFVVASRLDPEEVVPVMAST